MIVIQIDSEHLAKHHANTSWACTPYTNRLDLFLKPYQFRTSVAASLEYRTYLNI